MTKSKQDQYDRFSLPKTYQRFIERYPEIAKHYEELGSAIHDWGPLDDKTGSLIKLGIAIGAKSEGAVHSHVRRALASKASAEEIRHAILLSVTTVGFPRMMAALSWAEDILTME